MLGYECAQELMTSITDIEQQLFVDPGLRQEFQRRLEAQGEVQNFEAEFRCKNGGTIWVSLNARLVLNNSGALRYYEGSFKNITERKRAEIVLRNMEKIYRCAIGGAGAVPYSYDYKTKTYAFMGEGIEQLIGYSPGEITPELWNSIIVESVMLGETAGLDKKEAARRVMNGELRHWRCDMLVRTREGKLRWISDASVQNLDGTGRSNEAMGILEDITERKQAEINAVTFSKLGQSLFLAATPQEAARMVGEVADELFGWDACTFFIYSQEKDEIYPALYIDTIDGQRIDTIPTGLDKKPTSIDRRVIAQGGELILKKDLMAMEPGARPYGNKSRPSASIIRVPVRVRNKVTGILSIHSYTPQAYGQKDLNILQTLGDYCGGALERIWSDEAIRKSESQFRLVWESSKDGMRLTDREGNILMVNQAYCQMVQKSKAELEGQLLSIIHRMEDGDRVLCRHRECIDSNAIESHLESEVILWNGKKVWFEFSNSPLELPGQPQLLLSIFRDITPRKQAEAELEAMHRQLLDASRQAGMAEVATSVLHNVGNVLNSVNVGCSQISDKVRNSKVPKLAKATALMEAHASTLPDFFAHDPKGKQLPGYLSALAVHLADEQEEMLQELASLNGNIEHIKQIVAMQQSYARISGIFETLQVTDLVEDAVRMNAGAMERHQVKVIRDYAAVPPVTVDKHKVLQILINLIRNAKYALDEGRPEEKRMTLRVESRGDKMVAISVIDNGIGISVENLTRIFAHGFTTRKEGHGFGLHSGALTAKELGGSLTVQSDGAGKGAAFTLEFPCQPQQTH